jgi:hypothetical protein
VARSGYEVLRSLDRQLRRRSAPTNGAHTPCVPWKFDRELATAGLSKVASRACNFIFFPLHDKAPRASDRLNRSLGWLSGTPLGPWLGSQYVLKATTR